VVWRGWSLDILVDPLNGISLSSSEMFAWRQLVIDGDVVTGNVVVSVFVKLMVAAMCAEAFEFDL